MRTFVNFWSYVVYRLAKKQNVTICIGGERLQILGL